MKIQIKIALIALLFLIPSSLVFAEVRFFPILEDHFKPERTASLLIGSTGGFSAVGVELSMACGLFEIPGTEIRQQVSFTSVDSSVTLIELNPHYMIKLQDQLKVGFGPGLGYATSGGESSMTVQAGASLHYRMDSLFFGASAIQQFVMSGGDNFEFYGKIGYNF
ncbi:MAG: hypothetical protein OEY59_13205 [Deltaproteobacteria bacterium]|nr:hypothetical protein [Deltaproteobacteria bacterium]